MAVSESHVSSGVSRWVSFFNRISKQFAASRTSFAIQMPDGQRYTFGEETPVFEIIAKDAHAVRALASLNEGVIANAYLKGEIDVQGGFSRFYDLRTELTDRRPLQWIWRFIAPVLLGQVRLNKSAIHTHYDRDPSFYLSFLDEQTRCYTQAMFEDPGEPIEVAVRRKLDFCIDQCKLGPGSDVLEVGPGWGAFSEHAAKKGINITGITISQASLDYMQNLSQDLDLPIKTVFDDILTYQPGQKFDAVVIMGIMEHLPDYPRVLRKFQSMLKPGGYVYLDASASRVKYKHSSFITEHIYPGNHSFFSLHNFLAAVAKTPFQVRGVWDDRLSYHHTFACWARRFDENKDFIIAKFGEEDYRRFRLYLWGSAHCFLHDTLQCYRIVLRAA